MAGERYFALLLLLHIHSTAGQGKFDFCNFSNYLENGIVLIVFFFFFFLFLTSDAKDWMTRFIKTNSGGINGAIGHKSEALPRLICSPFPVRRKNDTNQSFSAFFILDFFPLRTAFCSFDHPSPKKHGAALQFFFTKPLSNTSLRFSIIVLMRDLTAHLSAPKCRSAASDSAVTQLQHWKD